MNQQKTLVFAIALVLVAAGVAMLPADQETAQDGFLRRFSETAKTQDTGRLEDVVRVENPPVVFDAVMSQAYQGIVGLAEEKDAQSLFETAEEIAALYIGAVLDILGQRDAALEVHRQALELDRRIGNGLGNVHDILGHYAEALNCFKGALQVLGPARDLMIETFGSLGQGKSVDALRRAKLLLKATARPIEGGKMSLAHPFFWAAFVLVGGGE